jgi:ubiquinone/menaquinone biosynthesis C-methylase UbiE
MAQQSQQNTYTQGYSSSTIATHLSRTAESNAAFLLPHIKNTDHILNVGCGPGTITTGLAKYASEGKTIGLDISLDVLQKAQALATEASIPSQGPGSVIFEQGNVLEHLPYPDDTFDIVYSSQVFGHLSPPDQPQRALAEIRRVLRPGGVLATSDAADQHFYPRSLGLDRLWVQNSGHAIRKGAPEGDPTGTIMPVLFRSAGFDDIRIGAGTTVFQGPEARKWLAGRGAGQMKKGDPFRQSWLDVGITGEEIEEALSAVGKWAEMEDAWYAALQCEMLAWK